MNIACGEWQDVPHELLMDFGERRGLDWNSAAKSLPHFVWYRLPNRALSYVLRVIQNVVKHQVRLGSKSFPIDGVKRLNFLPTKARPQLFAFARQKVKHRIFLNAHS